MRTILYILIFALLSIGNLQATDLDEIKIACDKGDIKTCSILADLYYDGTGAAKQDFKKSFQLHSKICDKGDSSSCRKLGNMYSEGIGVKKNRTKAKKLYKKVIKLAHQSCNNGNAKECLLLSFLYKRGEFIKKDLEMAKSFETKACQYEQKTNNAASPISACYYIALTEKDTVKANKLYLASCNAGAADSCKQLADDYNILEENLDYKKYKELMKKAIYIYDKKCYQTTEFEAFTYYSCNALGHIYEGKYEDKEYIFRDYSKAIKLYKRSCESVYQFGCENLANMFYEGKGTGKDDFEAFKYYKKACDATYGEGCYMLGKMYEEGRGVRQDNIKAKEFYGKACDEKDTEGCKNYSRLNKINNVGQ